MQKMATTEFDMKDKFYYWISRKLPKRLMYWCAIHVCAYVSCNEFSNKTPDEINIMEALKSYNDTYGA